MSSDNPTNPDENLLVGHEYDGIQELDNPLPNWWLWLFLFSLVFAFLYYVHYELDGGGLSSDAELKLELSMLEKKKVRKLREAPAVDKFNLEAVLAQPEKLLIGQKSYTQNCASCHGEKGQGGIGPNLTDSYWLHSRGEFEKILLAINTGFPNKGMPAWKALIAPNTRPLIAAYVYSLKGTNPPNAKAPQGKKVE